MVPTVPLENRRSLLKERICSLGSFFFFFHVRVTPKGGGGGGGVLSDLWSQICLTAMRQQDILLQNFDIQSDVADIIYNIIYNISISALEYGFIPWASNLM